MRGEDWKQHNSYFIYSQGPLLLSGAAKRRAREISPVICYTFKSLYIYIKTTAKIREESILVIQNKSAKYINKI